MEVVPGIHKVDGTWGGNVYLLLDDDGVVLVDAALPFNSGNILRYIQYLGGDPSELRSIILTHAHPDHTGAIPMLRQLADLTVCIHPNDTRRDREGRPRLHYPGQLVTLPLNLPFVRPIYAQNADRGGTRLPRHGWYTCAPYAGAHLGKCLPVPGGAAGADNGRHADRRFYRPLPFPGTDFRAYRQFVERLAELDFDVACVGHGRPVVGGAAGKVRQMLDSYRLALFPWRHLRKLLPLR